MMRDKPGPQGVRHRRAFDMNGLCLLGGLNGVNIYIYIYTCGVDSWYMSI